MFGRKSRQLELAASRLRDVLSAGREALATGDRKAMETAEEQLERAWLDSPHVSGLDGFDLRELQSEAYRITRELRIQIAESEDRGLERTLRPCRECGGRDLHVVPKLSFDQIHVDGQREDFEFALIVCCNCRTARLRADGYPANRSREITVASHNHGPYR